MLPHQSTQCGLAGGLCNGGRYSPAWLLLPFCPVCFSCCASSLAAWMMRYLPLAPCLGALPHLSASPATDCTTAAVPGWPVCPCLFCCCGVMEGGGRGQKLPPTAPVRLCCCRLDAHGDAGAHSLMEFLLTAFAAWQQGGGSALWLALI